jgi:hypothetical protein
VHVNSLQGTVEEARVKLEEELQDKDEPTTLLEAPKEK